MNENKLSKLMGLAINDYKMINENEKIVVGISGGIDSITLFMLLQNRLKRILAGYQLYPVIVDNFNGEYDEQNKRIFRLSEFFNNELNCELTIIKVKTAIKVFGNTIKKRDACYLCAQKRRNELIKFADKNCCKKIALGHHKDDIIETTLMNMLFKRELSSMLPRLDIFEGKMSIIRPLAYFQKNQIEDYIYNREIEIPCFGEICPSKIVRRDSRREQVREMVNSLSNKIPNIKNNIFAAFRNPKNDYLLNQYFNPKTSGLYKRP